MDERIAQKEEYIVLLNNNTTGVKIGYFEILAASRELEKRHKEKAKWDEEIQRKANKAWKDMHDSLREKGVL